MSAVGRVKQRQINAPTSTLTEVHTQATGGWVAGRMVGSDSQGGCGVVLWCGIMVWYYDMILRRAVM